MAASSPGSRNSAPRSRRRKTAQRPWRNWRTSTCSMGCLAKASASPPRRWLAMLAPRTASAWRQPAVLRACCYASPSILTRRCPPFLRTARPRMLRSGAPSPLPRRVMRTLSQATPRRRQRRRCGLCPIRCWSLSCSASPMLRVTTLPRFKPWPAPCETRTLVCLRMRPGNSSCRRASRDWAAIQTRNVASSRRRQSTTTPRQA